MRKYLHINLRDRSVETEELHGEAIVRAGRHHIAKTLLKRGVATVDPLTSPSRSAHGSIGVPGLTARPARAPAALIARSVRTGADDASA